MTFYYVCSAGVQTQGPGDEVEWLHAKLEAAGKRIAELEAEVVKRCFSSKLSKGTMTKLGY